MSKFYTPKKPCSRCGTSQRYASNSSCVLCKKNTEKKRYEENREDIKERNKKWAKNNPGLTSSYKKSWKKRNPEKVKNSSAAYRLENKERISQKRKENQEYMREYSRVYRDKNKCRAREAAREYYKNNSKKIKKRAKDWADSNKDRVRDNAKAYQKTLRRTEIGKSIIFMRACIRRCLIRKNNGERTVDLIGYSPNELKRHLENQFHSSMDWSNYGTKWHIDHITPISYFIKQGIKDPKVINCLSNLRPIHKIENLRKSDNIEFLL